MGIARHYASSIALDTQFVVFNDVGPTWPAGGG
jgi:hypothetical protein